MQIQLHHTSIHDLVSHCVAPTLSYVSSHCLLCSLTLVVNQLNLSFSQRQQFSALHPSVLQVEASSCKVYMYCVTQVYITTCIPFFIQVKSNT